MPEEDASPLATSAPQTVSRAGLPASLFAAAILAWMGALVSFLLLKGPAALQGFLCPARASCDVVLKSQFATIAGVPLSLAGAVFYLSILGFLLLVCAMGSRPARVRWLEGILWLLVAGLTFSAGLMYLQFGVLHAFCPLCTSSFVLIVGALLAVMRAKQRAAAEDWPAARGVALSLALFAALPTAIFLSPRFVAEKPAMWIDLSTAQVEGPANARVQLVVFSDFQCPFCRLLAPTLKRLHEEFPEDVALVFRPFPLDAHPRAFPAAVAAECAGEQGKFWEYHDQLFAEGDDLSDARLMAIASAVGLDTTRFDECWQSGRMKARVEASRQDAMARGLEGVPMLFLNGQRVAEGLDYEHLAQRIQKLLQADPRAAR